MAGGINGGHEAAGTGADHEDVEARVCHVNSPYKTCFKSPLLYRKGGLKSTFSLLCVCNLFWGRNLANTIDFWGKSR